jgi:hypothetical protein
MIVSLDAAPRSLLNPVGAAKGSGNAAPIYLYSLVPWLEPR